MGIFSNKTKRLIGELRQRSQHYSNDLTQEINEKLDELKAEYEESSDIFPEFNAFLADLNTRISAGDAEKLEQFAAKLAQVDRSARRGIDAMWEISKNQRKLTAESLREFEALEQ